MKIRPNEMSRTLEVSVIKLVVSFHLHFYGVFRSLFKIRFNSMPSRVEPAQPLVATKVRVSRWVFNPRQSLPNVCLGWLVGILSLHDWLDPEEWRENIWARKWMESPPYLKRATDFHSLTGRRIDRPWASLSWYFNFERIDFSQRQWSGRYFFLHCKKKVSMEFGAGEITLESVLLEQSSNRWLFCICKLSAHEQDFFFEIQQWALTCWNTQPGPRIC